MKTKLRGRVEKRDLEGGVFQLVSDTGTRTTLVGAKSELAALVGKPVEVEGVEDEGGGFGLAMAGPQFTVSKVRKL